MIQPQTILKVLDNSGAKTVKCIKILEGFKKRFAKLGDIIIVSVQELRNKEKLTSKIKKKEIFKALIIQTKKKIKKKDGLITFINNKNKNSVVLLNKKGNPIATRIVTSVPTIFKKKKLSKILSISIGLI